MVGERAPSPDIADWSLTIAGLVLEPVTIDLETYLGLAHETVTFDIHCVTSWTRRDSTFVGVPLSRLAQPRPEARFVSFTAFSDRGHHTSLPADYAMERSWLVHQFEGEPLTIEHGGPVRVVTPGRYFYKSVKWVRSIEFLAQDRPGWWEVNSSYHNNADPLAGDQRFTTGSIRPEQLARFMDTDNLDKYRGRVMIGVDLRAWKPRTRDLSRLQLKGCNLDGVDLTGANLRYVNLSLSSMRGTVLAHADLGGSDLEGADLSGADLTGADLSGTALSATRFDGAKVAGARFDGAWGLLEDQAAQLESLGVSLGPQ
ncbi:MAG TPA: molybdopterin-dependent oxidoreductase [Acidimicrobiia bacterium]|nr:molybdopterin-dependent oxidoreductase [Acidimicrobiia bacterium]